MGIIRKTKSIDLLLNEFNEKSDAISTVDLIKRLSEKINKTTIYRVLDKLEEDDDITDVYHNISEESLEE